MRVVLLGTACVLSMLAATPVREVLTQAIYAGGVRVSEFRHGYLVTFPPGDGPTTGFSAFDPDGKLAYDKLIELPGGGSHSSVVDIDFDADGNAAVAASATGSTPCNLHGLLLLDRTGRQTRFIDTGCYVIFHIAIAPDHSIWTLGYQRDSGGTEEIQEDYMIVRQFTLDGKQTSAFLPRSSFPKGRVPGTGPRIEATPDRVGVLAYSGNMGPDREWVELDMSGKIVERLPVDGAMKSPTSVAFTADDHVYLYGGRQLFTLDTASHAWKPIPKE
jgi:hypothetical protein